MTGIDVVKISRVALALKRRNFLVGAFTENERKYYFDNGEKTETLAGLFAAKEAVVKALGTGFIGVRPSEIEIIHDEKGRPYAALSPRVSKLTGIAEIEVSITHEGDFAFAAAGPECKSIETQAMPILEYAAAAETEPQLWLRQPLSHKGDYGRVYVIGGSPEMVGAPLMCALAALNTGAGLVTLCVPKSLAEVYQERTLQNTLLFMPDRDGKILFDSTTLDNICDKADVVAIGMGMGKNDALAKIISYLAQKEITLLIDADGLNAVASDLSALAAHRCRLILTPHVGEFNRLCKNGESVSDLAKNLACVVMKKAAVTEISDGQSTIKTAFGSPSLAKGGSGDILAGITAALCNRLPALEACQKACYVLGRAALESEEIAGEDGVTAELLLQNIRGRASRE